MIIEHIGIQVDEPVAASAWYVEHLGLEVRRYTGAPTHTTFLADPATGVMVEIYNNPRVTAPDYRTMDPLLLHLAFSVDDPVAERDRLLAAGATVAEDLTVTPLGDTIVMLRDPWGFAVQLVKRAQPLSAAPVG